MNEPSSNNIFGLAAIAAAIATLVGTWLAHTADHTDGLTGLAKVVLIVGLIVTCSLARFWAFYRRR